MEIGTQPNFIPHEAPGTAVSSRAPGRGMAELLLLVSIVLFAASVALAAGIFLYGEYLQSSARSKIGQLERAKAAFEPSLIHELTRLDDRMHAAGEVLGRHISPSAFFRMLEQTTISTVGFTSLSLESSDVLHMKIKMNGVAASVNSIALQADLFSKGGMVTSPIFSNIDRESDGVHFNLSALLDPAAINYSQLVGVASAQAEAPAAPREIVSPFNAPTPLPGAPEEKPALQEKSAD